MSRTGKSSVIVFCWIAIAFSTIGFAQDKHSSYSWLKEDSRIALVKNDQVIWQFNFDKAADKPYFHPLRTPSGLDITLERPADHPWHRGLWFSWKAINGVNYWEEDPKTGLSKGRSIIRDVKYHAGKASKPDADIKVRIDYADSSGVVLSEKRSLLITAPENGQYMMTWQHEFTAVKDAVLYLEKPGKHGGVSWGGYAGLSYRGSDQLKDVSFFASSTWTNTADLTGYGEQEKWMGVKALNKGNNVSLIIFDHPRNPRHPSPWYIWYAKDRNLFFTPSLLFDGPMELKKGQKLKLQYGVWIMDGWVNPTQVENQYSRFIKK